MQRRDFIRLSVAGSAVGIIAPKLALARSSSMAGGVYYTKEAPGRWSKKAAGHLPTIEVLKGSGKKIKVVTPHEMKGYEHYITKHVVLDKDYGFIAEKIFDPSTDKAPISEFSLGDYSGRIHVLSVCNLHDTWLNFADV
jgi:superoxide reductase